MNLFWVITGLQGLALTIVVAYRDRQRIESNLEYMYKYSERDANKYALPLAALIYLPCYAIIVLGFWLGEEHTIGYYGCGGLFVAALLWYSLGYFFTGARAKDG